jgi:hypothetical protein
MPNIAAFISPHGFGHASRTCAILEALGNRIPDLHFHIFTRTPEWFFRDSLIYHFKNKNVLSDVGLVQTSALSENLPVTLRTLDDYIPFPDHRLNELSVIIRSTQCQLVLCDISPLGIEVARRADLPSVLIENFTWDWIYASYTQEEPEFQRFIDLLSPVFLSAIYHIQARPHCADWHQPNLTIPPVSRSPRKSPTAVRTQLDISPGEKVVLITLGGIRGKLEFLDYLPNSPEIRYIIPGASNQMARFRNQVHLPFHTPIFHPDLVNASDAIIGKAGYSTIAEAFHAGVPFGFVPRLGFREAPILENFILENLHGVRIEEEAFFTGQWQRPLDKLLTVPVVRSKKSNGADQAAKFIADLMQKESRDD